MKCARFHAAVWSGLAAVGLALPLVVAAAPKSPTAPAPAAPRAARSVHLGYAAPEGLAFYNEVTVEESQPGTYFCVCGFNHGYFGIQQLSNGRDKVVIFSVWDAGKQNNPNEVAAEQRVEVLHGDPDVRVSRFGGEGTGGKSMFSYEWQVGQTYRCLVKATIEDKKTAYAAYFYLPAEKRWKHLATFRTTTGGDPLRGYYSFVEDFRRDGKSPTERRRARFGNGWVQGTKGEWTALAQATFTGDSTPLTNIDAGVRDGRFFLATGGDTVNQTPLKTTIRRPPEGLELPQDIQDMIRR